MTNERRALIQELLEIQNRDENQNRDMLTITGFMSDEEVRQHIERWREPRRPVKAVRS